MNNILQVTLAAGNFKTLTRLLEEAGLVEELRQPGPFTLFAPTDAAFAKLPAGTLEGLLANKEKLAALLRLHIVPDRICAWDVISAEGMTTRTLNTESLHLTVLRGNLYANGAQVISPDVFASNGVIHVIDQVLLPMPAITAGFR